VVEALDGLAAAVDTEEARSLALQVKRAATGPLRVAVAGRVKAGKSTLVNALLRQRVAPTAVGECTKLVTWYSYGVPEQLCVVRRDGGRSTYALRPDGSLPPDLPVPLEEVDHLEVSLSVDALKRLTLIDTPGLASTTTAVAAATRELLALDGASRGAVAAADVLLLVLPVEPRADELEVLARFDEQFQGVSHTALNAVGVLSRVDQSAVPASEVPVRAAALSRRLLEDHRLQLASVLPVNGLLAETASCGALTERDVSTLRDLVALGPERVRLLLLCADRFASAVSDVPAAARQRLVELLDLHGVERALELLATATGAAALSGALLEHSGFDALHREVFAGFARRHDVHKASWALGALLRAHVADPSDAARVRDVVEQLLLNPDLHAVRVLRAVQSVASGDVALAPDLADDLRRLADHVGLDPDAPDAGLRLTTDAAVAGARRWRAVAGDARSGPRLREVAEIATRAYENLL
jgi:hypothetical protein